ncbi:MAG: hypothetical protein WAN26_02505 [Steroidobacteraceae bacterium]
MTGAKQYSRAVVQSRPRVALRQATRAVQSARDKLGAPVTFTGSFEGTALAFQQSLAYEPMVIGVALLGRLRHAWRAL